MIFSSNRISFRNKVFRFKTLVFTCQYDNTFDRIFAKIFPNQFIVSYTFTVRAIVHLPMAAQKLLPAFRYRFVVLYAGQSDLPSV